MSKTFADLIARVNNCGMKTVSVAVAQDSAVLEAVVAAKERKIANAILVGDEKKIREIADSLKMDLSGFEIINVEDMTEAAHTANEFGNTVQGNVITVETKNSIIEGSDKLIAAVGLEGMIVVDTEDALLICDKNHAGDIKKVLENLRICNRNEYI